MNTTTALIAELSQAVEQATGVDPRTEPCFEGVTVENCERCHTLTAVTTLLIGYSGDISARVCIECMWVTE